MAGDSGKGPDGVADALRAAIDRTLATVGDGAAGSAALTRERATQLLDEVARRGREARDEVNRRGREARHEVSRRGREAREGVARRVPGKPKPKAKD